MSKEAKSVHFELEGQHLQDPSRWSIIGKHHRTSFLAGQSMGIYRGWNKEGNSGWLDFRIVRVTSTREIISNTGSNKI